MQGSAVPVSELFLVPLQSKGAPPLGTLWVIGKEADISIPAMRGAMSDLAAFAAIACA